MSFSAVNWLLLQIYDVLRKSAVAVSVFQLDVQQYMNHYLLLELDMNVVLSLPWVGILIYKTLTMLTRNFSLFCLYSKLKCIYQLDYIFMLLCEHKLNIVRPVY